MFKDLFCKNKNLRQKFDLFYNNFEEKNFVKIPLLK